MQSILSQVCRYWHTLRYLKPIQFYGRFKLLFKTIQIDQSFDSALRFFSGGFEMPARKPQSMFSKSTLCFLNETHEIISSSDWNNQNLPRLWLYNLHYFDDINAFEASSRVEFHQSLINRWIDENPIGIGSGWESYPTSLRIVNWIKWSLLGNTLQPDWLRSLGLQARYLSKNLEIHLMGNHIFSNAKALFFAGSYFEGNEANLWYSKGLKIIKQELDEQVLDDGAHFELSPMYHMIFLEDLLDIINIHLAYRRTIPDYFFVRIDTMFDWLEGMCHPDGEISFFNDSAFGVAPSVAELRNYRKRLYQLCNRKLKPYDIAKKSLTEFLSSGYSNIKLSNMFAILDCAPIGPDYLPGHAHADTLSFELSLFERRLIVNSGTSTYDQGEYRQKQRSTLSHSTVEVDGQDSSEVWSAFRVARRAKVINYSSKKINNRIIISACHDGYSRLSNKKKHCREWIFEDEMLTITDRISGKGECCINSILPIHPEVILKKIEDNQVILEVNKNEVFISIEGNGKLIDLKSRYHQEFGSSVENVILSYKDTGSLPIELVTRIRW